MNMGKLLKNVKVADLINNNVGFTIIKNKENKENKEIAEKIL